MSAVPAQDRLFASPAAARLDRTTVFQRNMTLPVHRWFRYSAGFSAAWVEHEIRERSGTRPPQVLDPFAGSGTTLIAAQQAGADSIGLETHPLVVRVAQAKLSWPESANAFEARVAAVVRGTRPQAWPNPPSLMGKIYSPATLASLRGLRETIERLQDGSAIDGLAWLAVVGILRRCSPVGTAQWQYVLPNKAKAAAAEPLEAFVAQAAMMAADMRDMGDLPSASAELREEDAREAASVPDEWADLVITSPPYPNNYDYADATRIEMTFLGEITGWGDLQDAVRTRLVRSCSQHMVRFDALPLLESAELAPIAEELRVVYDQLVIERGQHGGRKNYHSMVVAYFHDLACTWRALRRACAPGAEALFVVGDSAPYGVHLPVERWLGELAIAAGFEGWDFVKLRERNKGELWKSRKHRVLLHEGVLRVQG